MNMTDLCFADPAYIHREVSLRQIQHELTEEEAIDRMANEIVLATLKESVLALCGGESEE